jgi:membrane associated rhomboid family serine protease
LKEKKPLLAAELVYCLHKTTAFGDGCRRRVPMVGASGAIAGVMGAYFRLYPRTRIVVLIFLFIFIDFIEVPAFFFLAFWFVLQFISGADASAAGSASGGVAWWAHIGGFASGIVLLFVFKKRK